jgi:tetratricopeptide (TPR) repeat protein
MTLEPQTESAAASHRLLGDLDAAVAASDWQTAYAIANRAISKGARHSRFFMVRAHRMENSGHLQFALEDYQRATALAPDDIHILEALAHCAMKMKGYRIAVDAYDSIVAQDPSHAQAFYRRGVALAHLGDSEGAQRSHERAIEADPQCADALASLSSIMVRKGDLEKARLYSERALAANSDQATAAVSLGQAYMAERRHADAEKQFADVLASGTVQPTNRAQVLTLLGDALDGQKKYAEAFAAYTTANAELRRLHADEQSGSAAESARSLIGYFENEQPSRWKTTDDGDNVEGAFDQHVFLLGFMRSGTTLLEQVLATSPDIAALEEKGLLIAAGEEYLTSIPALDKFATLDHGTLTELRRQYWKRVRDYLPGSTAKVFVDKQPLNTTKLPLIAKLFPKARILFAIRDPRDVVFSCFRRNFRVTGTQFEFLTTETCARIYSLIMRIGELSREKFELNLLEHRYEDMVQDFDGRVRAVCEFIGIEWSDTMRRFDEHASVADLRSPSALQVRRPLYGEGIGQWRRYGEQLKPVLPILEPWVEKFGYPRD